MGNTSFPLTHTSDDAAGASFYRFLSVGIRGAEGVDS